MAESDQELLFVNNINDFEKELRDNSFSWSDVCMEEIGVVRLLQHMPLNS